MTLTNNTPVIDHNERDESKDGSISLFLVRNFEIKYSSRIAMDKHRERMHLEFSGMA
jgi:hypothetical protein